MAASFSLDSDGYFQHGGKRFFPVGVNYWPGSCGVEMWQHWPADEIRRDLDIVADLGLNTVRFFLRWQDFEPTAGQYNPLMFERLSQLMNWIGERHLLAHPSLFVGWMSGGIFWPQWREGRNLFADVFMRERSAAFARVCAQHLYPHRNSIVAMDQGNELCCLPDSHQAPPESVIEWCRSVSAAIRSAWPDALIISGNEQSQIICDSGWRFGQQPGCDLYSMHAYPVPNWHPILSDGLSDPLTQSLLPLYVKCARAFGPVMAQEFGTILTFDRKRQHDYLRHMLPACRDAGANGFLWWCLRDITAAVPPYLDHAFESTLGLVDAAGKVKPGLEYFIEFARELNLDANSITKESAASPAVGVYWPSEYYNRRPIGSGINHPASTSSGLLLANYFLSQLGYHTQIVRGDGAIPDSISTLVIAGCALTAPEAQRLTAWVKNGGRLLWHGINPHNFGTDYIELLGACPIDYHAPLSQQVSAFGREWTLDTFSCGCSIEVQPTSAKIFAEAHGRAILLHHDVGHGRVVYSLPQIEQMIAAFSGDRKRRDSWMTWYKGVMQLLLGNNATLSKSS